MLILLSPAKTFARTIVPFETRPIFINDALSLISKLRLFSVATFVNKMKISKNLAIQVHHDYQTFDLNPSCAIYAYAGYLYKGLDINHFDEESLDYLKSHLYILSGLYGIVRPFDGISFYRLEIKDKIIRDLYAYWKPKIKKYLKKHHSDEILINLASMEYSKVLHHHLNVITISFFEIIDGKPRAISMHIKMMRGKMARYLITQKIDSLAQIKSVIIDDYYFDAAKSTPKEYVFIKRS
ncbi:MAG: YaaA family protein [Bacillota bacterium]